MSTNVEIADRTITEEAPAAVENGERPVGAGAARDQERGRGASRVPAVPARAWARGDPDRRRQLRPHGARASAGDHLLSGLVPLAVLGAVAILYPHLRAGVRAATSMTLGAIVFVVGVPGVYYLLDGSAAFDHYTALLALPAGIILLASGPVILWNARRTGR